MMRAQVSTEYLVIVVVLLVIGLTVTLLLGGFSSVGSEGNEKLGQRAWATAFPLSVRSVTWAGNSMSFYLKNNGLEKLTIRFMRFSPYSAANMNVILNSQEEKKVSFGVWPSCPGQGQYYEFTQFYFKYDTDKNQNFTQSMDVSYIGKCL